MQTDLIYSLTDTFEAHAQQTEGGIEFWLARDLQYLLGYTKWDNFLNVVSKAKTACNTSGHDVSDHFADVGKMVDRDAMPPFFRNSFMPGIDFRCFAADNSKHIRPLAVRPLTYSEGVPTPWGFFISVADSSLTEGSCHD